jgi:hypothetical protein
MGQLRDVESLDSISSQVGREGFLSPYAVDDCLLPAPPDSEQRDAAVFDRYYWPDDGQEAVLVDVLLAGPSRPDQEAAKQCELKKRWCAERGVKYLVVVDDMTYS